MTQKEIELGQNIRTGLNNVLKLWASKDVQLEYQKNIAIADVSAELFCQWCDDYYNEDSAIMRIEFTQIELDAYKEFNKVLCEISDATPEYLPPIEKFIITKEWEIIHNAAISALLKIELDK